jgi:hypothetical protein
VVKGENYVKLIGKIVYPSLKKFGDNNFLFKGKIRISTQDEKERFQYIKIAAWGSLAEALEIVSSQTNICILGHIEERSYNAACRHCGGPDKKFWTEVMVDSFVIIDD